MSASRSPSRASGCRALWLIAFLIASVSRGTSQTTILHLKNGDRFSGSLVSEQAGSVVLTNALWGQVTIPRSEIQHIETTPAPAAAPTNQPVIALTGPQERRLGELLDLYRAGRISPAEYHEQRSRMLAEAERTIPGTNVVALKPGAPAPATGGSPVPATLPAAATPVKPAGPKRWSGEAQLGLDFAITEKDRQLVTGRLKLNYTHGQLRNALDYLFTYGRTDGELSANRMDGSVKTDYDLLKRLYIYNLGGAGYDQVRKIDLRFEEGPGAGAIALRATNYSLRVEYGINYQAQFNSDGSMNDRFYHRYAEYFTWRLGPRFSLDEKFEFFPTWGNWRNYRFRFEANARYLIAPNLSFVVTVLDLYDTDPPVGVGQNDLQVRSSIGVKF